MISLRIVLIAALLCFSAAATARADNVDADALINEGLRLREAHEDARALELFQHAYQIEQSPRALAQIALAEQALGHWVRAYMQLSEAMTHVDNEWISSRAPALHAALEDARTHVGFLQISGGAPGLHAWIGTRDLGALPIREPVVVDAGVMDVELRDGGDVVSAQRVLRVDRGATVGVELPPPHREPPPLARTTTHAPPTPLPRILGWTSLGVGVAALGVGVAFHAMRNSAAADANACLDDLGALTSCTIEEQRSRQSSVDTDTTLMAVGYIGGGVLVAAGALLLILAPSDETQSHTAFRCVPSFPLGAACTGSF